MKINTTRLFSLTDDNYETDIGFASVNESNNINRAIKYRDHVSVEFIDRFPTIPFVIITIIDINKNYRKQGYGRKLLKEIADKYPNHAILVESGASILEYPNDISSNDIQIVLNDLNEFYTKCGFVDINDYIGNFSEKRVYLYIQNIIGKMCYDEMILDDYNEYKKNYKIKHREGINKAKEKGVRFGRPPLALPDNFEEQYKLWKDGIITVKNAAENCGIKEWIFYRESKKRNSIK